MRGNLKIVFLLAIVFCCLASNSTYISPHSPKLNSFKLSFLLSALLLIRASLMADYFYLSLLMDALLLITSKMTKRVSFC